MTLIGTKGSYGKPSGPVTYKFKIEIRRSKGKHQLKASLPDQFYYVGKSIRNGKDLFVSETYNRKATLKKTIASLFPEVITIDTDKTGK